MRFFASAVLAVVSPVLLLSHPAALAFVPTAPTSTRSSNAVVLQMQRHEELSQQAAKAVAASMLTATLLLAPPSSFAASTPPGMVAPALTTTSSAKKAAAAPVPSEKNQVDDAVKALKNASLKLVDINKDLVTAKSTSQRACLAVDQAQAKAKSAKDEVAKLKSASADNAKIGMFLPSCL